MREDASNRSLGETLIIRSAGRDDIADLQMIESSAAELFRDSPYPELADFPPMSSEAYEMAFATGDPVFVAEIMPQDQTNAKGSAFHKAGFAFCVTKDDGMHLKELSVHRSFQQRGIGKALIGAILQEAKARGAAFVSLTTYADLPWNGPFYRKQGFVQLNHEDMPMFLRTILQKEILHGANVRTRCAMRLALI